MISALLHPAKTNQKEVIENMYQRGPRLVLSTRTRRLKNPREVKFGDHDKGAYLNKSKASSTLAARDLIRLKLS